MASLHFENYVFFKNTIAIKFCFFIKEPKVDFTSPKNKRSRKLNWPRYTKVTIESTLNSKKGGIVVLQYVS